jgi:glycosyltransferase involved in cell wall biosynthesis
MWAVQALRNDYDVTVVTRGEVDLERLNAFYGTALKAGEFKIRQVPIPWWSLLVRKTGRGSALDDAPYQRCCRRIAHEFDVLISAYNFCDFGVPAIHCIADFSWDDAVRRSLHPVPPGLARFIYENSVLRRTYLRLAQFLSGSSGHNIHSEQDLILANSQWTADLMRTKYKLCANVLYPPVHSKFPSIPWTRRENGFVCLGRIDPVKRIERVIDILARVRQRGYNLHLHVIGRIGSDAYSRAVAGLCKAHAEWVIPEGARRGREKLDLLAAHRFGIHACNGEAFGIAVAEMVKAGCIPFVPKEGGQAEIVNHPSLIYADVDDAVNKIVTVLETPPVQADLGTHLANQGRQFSAGSFMNGIRTVVQQFLDRKLSCCTR